MVENRKGRDVLRGGVGGANQPSYLSFINSLPFDYQSIKIVSNIFIAFIGSGVLGLPYAFKRSGLIEGSFVMAVVAYFSMRAMLLLIDCQYKVRNVLQVTSSASTNESANLTLSDVSNGHSHGIKDKRTNGSGVALTGVVVNGERTNKLRQRELVLDDISPESSEDEEHPFVKVEPNKPFKLTAEEKNQENFKNSPRDTEASPDIITYSDVAFAAWGGMGRFVVDSSLICAQVGFCCGYLIFITENLSNYYISVYKTSWLVVLLPPLFFLTLIPDLRKLAVFSVMAQVSNLMAFAVVFWFDFEHVHLANVMKRKEISLKGFPFFFCAAVYCFEGAGMVLSLEQSVPTDRRGRFKKYFVATIAGITALYISFGASGYLSFGPDTKDIITLNLLSEESTTFIDFAALVKMFLCISLFFSYPMMMFPVTRMLQRKCAGFSQISGTSNNVQSTLKFLPMFIRFILVTVSGLVVCIVPNFSDLMNIIGAVFGTLLAFIMPGLCHYAIFRKGIKRADLIMDIMLIVIGCLGCILGVMEALKGDNFEVVNTLRSEAKDTGELSVIQREVFQNNYNNSDNLPPIVHSTGDPTVIKNSVSRGVAEAIEKSIDVAAATVTEKLSSVMSKINHSSTSDVLS